MVVGTGLGGRVVEVVDEVLEVLEGGDVDVVVEVDWFGAVEVVMSPGESVVVVEAGGREEVVVDEVDDVVVVPNFRRSAVSTLPRNEETFGNASTGRPFMAAVMKRRKMDAGNDPPVTLIPCTDVICFSLPSG